MKHKTSWVDDDNAALLTDLYQLTMVQAYYLEQMNDSATFTLFVRELPGKRNFLLAAGLADVLHYLRTVRFSKDSLAYLSTLPQFKSDFLKWLADFHFTGDLFAVPEGTPVFANEPILEVVAPLPQAQLIETFVMNQVHAQTVIASKAARVVQAAAGRSVIDFGLRRTHGADAGMKAARAAYLAGADATSNVLAGSAYGIPVAGTMAHSYIQAHENEVDAFAAFTEHYPETTLLVDTYDTIQGVQHVIDLAAQLGDNFRVRAIRLDSGDLAELSKESRAMLNRAGLSRVEIFASGGLDEQKISALVQAGAPIDGFGVGTTMGASADAPTLDMIYKMAEYNGSGRTKLAPAKPILPGRKQIFRIKKNGIVSEDVIGRADEQLPGDALLKKVMTRGTVEPEAIQPLENTRAFASERISELPEPVRSLNNATIPVTISARLQDYQNTVAERVARRNAS